MSVLSSKTVLFSNRHHVTFNALHTWGWGNYPGCNGCIGLYKKKATRSPPGWGETWLTNTRGESGTPDFVVLAGCGFLALQAKTGGTEELTAGVEVGTVWAFVSAVSRHVQLGTADLCATAHGNTLFVISISFDGVSSTNNTFLWLHLSQRKHEEIVCWIEKTRPECTDIKILSGVGAYPGRRSWRTSACWPCTPPLGSGPHTLAYSEFYSASPSHYCDAALAARCSSQSHASRI